MDIANIDIRNCIEENELRYWQVAAELDITDGNFSRKLRRELSEDEKAKVFRAIDKLVSARG